LIQVVESLQWAREKGDPGELSSEKIPAQTVLQTGFLRAPREVIAQAEFHVDCSVTNILTLHLALERQGGVPACSLAVTDITL
jgi:hypothetical protein